VKREMKRRNKKRQFIKIFEGDGNEFPLEAIQFLEYVNNNTIYESKKNDRG